MNDDYNVFVYYLQNFIANIFRTQICSTDFASNYKLVLQILRLTFTRLVGVLTMKSFCENSHAEDRIINHK